LERTNALSVHLVDRSGQLITTAGRSGDFDATSFASLVAADFTANAEISTLLGEPTVEAVVNEGRARSVHSCLLAERIILCTVFDRRSTLGLVRYRAKRAIRRLGPVFRELFEKVGLGEPCAGSPGSRTPRARGRRAVRRVAAHPVSLHPPAHRGVDMALINHRAREIHFKIVYYGPGLGGKTTNLQFLHERLPEERRGRLISIATDHDRTLFFDFLPVDLGQVNGFTTRFHLYTVPGQVYYRLSRRAVLTGADGIVFVADSHPARERANRDSLADLEEQLLSLGSRSTQSARIPRVFQWNKRDLRAALPVERLRAASIPRARPSRGRGVRGPGRGRDAQGRLQGGARAAGRAAAQTARADRERAPRAGDAGQPASA
jgi:signal recognition particle receptor subunit beta/predicted regulator of Ras-like GTPase activity (Roadblock/LC7/MglB family)